MRRKVLHDMTPIKIEFVLMSQLFLVKIFGMQQILVLLVFLDVLGQINQISRIIDFLHFEISCINGFLL